jgi:hypothetical protein
MGCLSKFPLTEIKKVSRADGSHHSSQLNTLRNIQVFRPQRPQGLFPRDQCLGVSYMNHI